MNRVSLGKAQRAWENRAYVRELLRQRQPGFAAALASAERYLLNQAGDEIGPAGSDA